MRCSPRSPRTLRGTLSMAVLMAVSPLTLAQDEAEPTTRLRHTGLVDARLLDVLDAPDARGMTFATWFAHDDGEAEIALFRLGLDDPAEEIPLRAIGEPEVAMRIDASIVPLGDMSAASRWRLVGPAKAQRAVVHDARNGRIGVLAFPSGEVLHIEEQATTLLDARARGASVEVLYEREGTLRWVRAGLGSEVERGFLPVRGFDPHGVDASFLTGTRSGVTAAGWRDGQHVGFVAALDASEVTPFELDAGVKWPGPPVAIGRALAKGGSLLAIGQPRANEGDGRVVLLQSDGGGVPAEIGWLTPPQRETPDPLALDLRFGAWLELAADVDADGLPELCVVSMTSPWGHRRLEVVRSGGEGARESFVLEALGRQFGGTSTSLDPTGRFVLVTAGSEPSSGPNAVPSQALLVEIGAPSRVRARLTTAQP